MRAALDQGSRPAEVRARSAPGRRPGQREGTGQGPGNAADEPTAAGDSPTGLTNALARSERERPRPGDAASGASGAPGDAHNEIRPAVADAAQRSESRSKVGHLDRLVDERRAQIHSGGLQREALVASPGFDPVRRVIRLGEDHGHLGTVTEFPLSPLSEMRSRNPRTRRPRPRHSPSTLPPSVHPEIQLLSPN